MPTNKTVITVVTSTLAIMACICVSTICFLAFKGIEVPPELNTLAGGLVGALSAMLTKTSPSEAIKQPAPAEMPAKVEVVNSPDTPVQTEEVK